MIQPLDARDVRERWAELIDEINRDPTFSDPLYTTQELLADLPEAAEKPDCQVLGVFRGGAPVGLFEFQIVAKDRYLEQIVGLSRSSDAYEEIAEYLQARFPGHQADFTLNPANEALRAMLTRRGAKFYEEQQRMTLTGEPPVVDAAGIEPLSACRREQYLAMHDTDCFWTGEKVAAAPERFSVYLAVDGDAVVGYIDVTNGCGVNEPFDLLVKPEHRGKGWGRRLLARAIEENRPCGMSLQVDVNNTPALSLYRSMGFVKIEGRNSQVATWNIP